jgi:hypothetical protein
LGELALPACFLPKDERIVAGQTEREEKLAGAETAAAMRSS